MPQRPKQEEGMEVRHEAQGWNERMAETPVAPPPIQVGGELLGRSAGQMLDRGETAGPERYWCGAMQAAKKPGLTKR